MFTKLFNEINQSLVAESLLSAEINALKEPKQDHFTPEDLYIGIINFCQRKHYPSTRERLYTLSQDLIGISKQNLSCYNNIYSFNSKINYRKGKTNDDYTFRTNWGRQNDPHPFTC